MLAAEDEAQLVATAEAFLLARLPGSDPNVAGVNQVVDQIMSDREITLVNDVTGRTAIGGRRLQRLFAAYTGVTPKVGHPPRPPP
jgi:transcriptional regulator GlxA family with amidase domain